MKSVPAGTLVALGGLFLGSTCGTGCGNGADEVVVEVRLAGDGMSGELDRVVLTYTASSGKSPVAACAPASIELSSQADGTPLARTLPYRVRFEPGNRFRDRLFVRVEGFRGGTLRYRTERMVSLSGGHVEVTVELTPECLDRGIEPGQMCLEARVLPAPGEAFFDRREFVLEDAPCGGS